MRLKRYASVALVAGLGLTVTACGSSASSSTPTTAAGSASSAPAAADTVTAINSLTGQGTSVTLNPDTAKALTGLGLTLAPSGSASFDSATSTVTFPITSGYAEIHSNHSYAPGYIVGSIQHDGSGLTISGAGKSVTLSDFVVDPGNSMLYGTVGGKPDVPLLYLDGSHVKVSMSGGNVVLDGTVAELTNTAATALDQTFGTTAVKAGLPLGTVHLVASGTATTYTDKTTAISRLGGQATNVALDASTVKALTGLGVTLGTYGTATLNGSTVSFPITGGFAAIHSDTSYKPGYIVGSIIHQGSGITLTAGGKTVTLSDFVVDPGDSILTGTVNGKIGVPLLVLDGSAVKVTPTSNGVTLDGTVAKLTQTAATALDQAFGTTALTAGIPLGTVHLVATASTVKGSIND
ncbi:hypothetical protein K6U06_22025 [Acidiferrimicrobium sp. IK]|uniref:hypothetical protein n=1 Tax=Acidiferrimicrobium sp. IK TaxID=2871700 RepID=UPI0021CAF5CA|nr:hypothetical protein [Acidiferrimicrobium sp. IK]MCU4187058.1 hypothetical protein [Acidiferrimicrobium sp. IK]